jgi:hypothetical protein
MLLEDDIEVSRYFYAYVKLQLLSHVYAGGGAAAEGGGGGEGGGEGGEQLVGLSLYTPRLVETRMPRRRIDLHAEVAGPAFLQQLPCSWGAVFFPKPWIEFHRYLRARLHEEAPAVEIPFSATNGWKGSWKKYLIELGYLRGWVYLYPNLKNQTSFSTNHMEKGEHIASKANTLKHLPIDFTVPLLQDPALLRTLWGARPDADAEPAAPPPLGALPVLDLFSERTSLARLAAQGAAATRKLRGTDNLLGKLAAWMS